MYRHWIALLLLALFSHPAATQDTLVWPNPPTVYVDTSSTDLEGLSEAVRWSVWMYNERTASSAVFGGGMEGAPTPLIGAITYKMGELIYFLDNFSVFTKGVTTTTYYLGTNTIAYATITLNPLYFVNGMDRCAGLIVMHEYIHAMGSRGHNDLAHTLMYNAPSHCRYFPTQEDLPMSASCHAEVSPVYDLYIPNILGMQVFLKNEGNNLWSVDWYSEAAEVRCDTYTIGDGVVNLHGVRSIEGTWEVILKEQEGLWRLVEATQ